MEFIIRINEVQTIPKYDFDGNGTYAAVWTDPIILEENDIRYILSQKAELVCERDPHCSLIYSSDTMTPNQMFDFTALSIARPTMQIMIKDVIVFDNPDKSHIVARLEDQPHIVMLANKLRSFGLSTSFPEFNPHITIASVENFHQEFHESNVIKVLNDLKRQLVGKRIVFDQLTIENLK